MFSVSRVLQLQQSRDFYPSRSVAVFTDTLIEVDAPANPI